MPSTSSSVHNTRRRQLIQAAALSVLVPAAYPAEAQIALSTAINRTARFRALSQRCAKAHTQLFLEVMPEEARVVLTTAQRLIQVGFDDLARGSFPADVAQQIALTRQEIGALTRLLATAPTKTSIATVSAQADKVLAMADKATTSLEAQAKQASAKLVNVAGRQRMLSQRLAKNYFLVAAGLESRPVRAQLAQDSIEFIEALGTLTSAPLSTPHIRNELALGQQQWMFFESALARKPDMNAMRIVATTSERLLEVMNNLTSLYESALKDLLGQA